MKLEEHTKALDEHIRNLNRFIEEGLLENQRNIGFNVSQGAVELFAIYIHSLHLIEGSGDQWDHRIFKSKKSVELKVPAVFAHREEILALMQAIELERNVLCYGKRQPEGRIQQMILSFQALRTLIERELAHEQQK